MVADAVFPEIVAGTAFHSRFVRVYEKQRLIMTSLSPAKNEIKSDAERCPAERVRFIFVRLCKINNCPMNLRNKSIDFRKNISDYFAKLKNYRILSVKMVCVNQI